jgi:hypothetical protein
MVDFPGCCGAARRASEHTMRHLSRAVAIGATALCAVSFNLGVQLTSNRGKRPVGRQRNRYIDDLNASAKRLLAADA